MINFGGIEMLSYKYLSNLESSRTDFNKNLKHLLSPRIDRILRLVTASSQIATDDKTEITQLWGEVKELSICGNRIAHNPVLPTWKPGSNRDRDQPDLIGVPDMSQMRNSDESDSISIDGMVRLVEASFDLAQRLLAASAKLRCSD